MAKDPLRTTHEQVGQLEGQRAWTALFYWTLAAFLAVFVWRYSRGLFAPGGMLRLDFPSLLGLFALHGLLTVFLERSLAFTPLEIAWRYRLAFLSNALLAAAHAIVLLIFSEYPVVAWSWSTALFLACAGGFAGGLIATGFATPLWENNFPPPEAIQAEVLRLHRQRFGDLPPVPVSKRWLDISLALVGLFVSAPVWAVVCFALWIEDPGPLLFVKNSVGRGGANFRQFKFRTMVRGAEESTGPVLAQRSDSRILGFGRLLRKTALDELPQLLNILMGEMSFVGPRPQRTVLVHEYLARMPEYADRHRVLPGLAGLAQVAGDYYLSPRQKLRFDRLYISYSGAAFDLKLMLLAFLITFWYRWQPGWNGRLPRRLLRVSFRP